MSGTENQTATGQSRLMHFGMMVCCAVMLLSLAGFFVAGGSIAGLWSNVSVFAPIVICVGAHLLLLKVMGKSCQNSSKGMARASAVDLRNAETSDSLNSYRL